MLLIEKLEEADSECQSMSIVTPDNPANEKNSSSAETNARVTHAVQTGAFSKTKSFETVNSRQLKRIIKCELISIDNLQDTAN